MNLSIRRALAVLAVYATLLATRRPMFGYKPPKESDSEPEAHYSLDLLPEEREALIDHLNGKAVGSTTKDKLRKRLVDAVRHHGPPLPPARLDWERAAREAERRGESLADYIFDQARGKEAA